MSPEEVSTLLESIEEVHENLTLLTDYFSEDQLALMRSIVQRSVDEDQYDYFASLQHVELVENWLENFQIPEVQELFYGVLKG